ncbi:xaa-Pro aminopeptidase ApepP-like [Pollicipes pollicipes]|uniref:xaa-Pro aminopeptidase ApepP-like n=1 Tax=Pollicipes pollicipes TaxID=41117 RepID=UPI0018857AC2|nr:xaa-Pro aminopeptidase ApepP-like [Pollicipes pollicipes]
MACLVWEALLLTAALLLSDCHSVSAVSSARTACADGAPPPPNRINTTERLRQLRELMADPRHKLQAYIVPMDDEHQTEYVSPHDARIEFISGFSGSSGLVVVTSDSAALWTDGRYFLQAESQMDCNWQLMRNGTEPKPPSEVEWLVSQLERGSSVGGDPRLIAAQNWLHFEARLRDAGMQMKLVYDNLIDLIWTEDRPPRPADPIVIQNLTYAGKPWEEKVAELRDYMKEEDVEVLLVTALDEVAWLLNLRGNDVPHTPVFRGYAAIDHDSVHLWVELAKVTDDVRLHLKALDCADGDLCVQLHRYDEVLYNFGSYIRQKWKGKILLPARSTYIDGVSFSFYNQVPSARRVFVESPIVRMKGRKNPVEIEGMKAANKRDSVALCQFLAFLEKEIQSGKEWDELSAADKLLQFRAEQDLFMGTSFETISAFGSNAAIIHYTPDNTTKRAIDTSSTYLLDSGGQYLDGTTDVTRTVHYGRPTEFQMEAYTRVLMGAIDLADLVINSQVKDVQMSLMVRQPLFKAGLNYRHGSGHGIGAYLTIHEGPILISPGGTGHLMEKGQFFSDEPGYYQDGEFGIRLETILFVQELDTEHNFDGPYMHFEPVTLVPFERNLIIPEMMSRRQLVWLNEYHRRVQLEVGPVLKRQKRERALKWLEARTAPIRPAKIAPSVGFTISSAGLPVKCSTVMLVWLTSAAISVARIM